jgi:hypothetical protein
VHKGSLLLPEITPMDFCYSMERWFYDRLVTYGKQLNNTIRRKVKMANKMSITI